MKHTLPVTVLALAAALLSGCATSIDKVTKSPELTASVPAATVVFIGSMAVGGETRPSIGTSLMMPIGAPVTADGINEDAKELGRFALEALPGATKQAAVQFTSSTKLLAKRPATREELNQAIGAEGAGKPVLIIQPVGARMECPGACFVFKLDAQLLPANAGATPLWSATMTAPPKASKFNDFSAPGKSVAEALVQQLKADGVVK